MDVEDLARACPLSKGLMLTLPDETTVVGGSSSNLMRVLVSLTPGCGLGGKNEFEAAEIDSWISYCTSSIEVLVDALKSAKAAGLADDKVFKSVTSDLAYAVSVLNCHMMYSTYMVGDSLTSADISISCALHEAALHSLWDPKSDDDTTENVRRWYNTITNQEFFLSASRDLPHTMGLSQKAASNGISLNGHGPPVENKLFRRNRTRIKEILNNDGANYLGKSVTVCGWARTTRNAGRLMFIELNDGSTGTSLQITCEAGATEGFEESKKSGGTGASFQITGVIIESPSSGQAVELKASESKLLGAVYGGDVEGKTIGGMLYPMAKKAHTLEHMRENAHLRPRASLHAAVMRIRHAMAYATHKFFHDNGFLYIHTPIITCADCEGAGEQFGVTNMLGNDHLKTDVKLSYHEAPKEESNENEEKKLSKNEMKRLAKQAAKAGHKEVSSDFGKPEDVKVVGAVDYTNDFFGRRANLTVSGQLNVETHACALSDVYTFGPTFRAENSHTSRHLAEFWMIEPEIAFADLNDDINLAEDYLKYCVKYALEMCSTDLEFLETSPFGEVGLRERLHNVLNNAFKVCVP
jgi:aspartyl/asparaginyl-tRNA synthetase